MVKHFEELWEEAEVVSSKIAIENIGVKLHSEIDRLMLDEVSMEEKGNIFGKVLFLLCRLSLKDNINTFAALLKETQNNKIESMNDDMD